MVYPIIQGSTGQSLKMKLLYQTDMDYQEILKRLETAQITFSMRDTASGKWKIANKPARVESTPWEYGEAGKELFLIVYDFPEKDINTVGYYQGQFAIKFLDCDDVVKVPVKEKLYINILESIVDI